MKFKQLDAAGEIVKPQRGNKFKKLIDNLLEHGGVKKKYRNLLLDDKAVITRYNDAFTSQYANPVYNYEFYEYLGDAIANSSISWYLARRFPQLCNPTNIGLLSTLYNNQKSTLIFSDISVSLGFAPFISADTNEFSPKHQKFLYEDVFEAFFGVTAYTIDEKFGYGLGQPICYRIIEWIYDQRHISLEFADVKDAKTRLKELAEKHPQLARIKAFTYRPQNLNDTFYITVEMRDINSGKITEMGHGENPIKAEAEKQAAEETLHMLEQEGIKLEVSRSHQPQLKTFERK